MSLARLDRRLLRFIGPSPSTHWLAPRACNEKTCAPARSVALMAVSKRKMTSAGGVHDRRKIRAIRFLLRWLPQRAGDLSLRAAVKMPAARNCKLPTCGGVTLRWHLARCMKMRQRIAREQNRPAMQRLKRTVHSLPFASSTRHHVFGLLQPSILRFGSRYPIEIQMGLGLCPFARPKNNP